MTTGLSPEELRDLIVSVGTHRGDRRLSPLDVSGLFLKAREAGATLVECAEAAGFSGPAMVTRFLRLQQLPEPVRDLVDWGASGTALAFTAASEIARLPQAAREPAARAALAAGLGTGEITQVVQRLLRSGHPADDAVEEILRLRPQVERRHVFVGRFADPGLTSRLEALDPEGHPGLLSDALRAAAGEAVEGDGRLSPTGFVVVTDDKGAAMLRAMGDFEAAVAATLADQLQRR